jgi:hypothetical protein
MPVPGLREALRAMSLSRPYPPDTYLGDDGEVSAWLRRSDESPDVTPQRGHLRVPRDR